jgi:hypothetical protein
MTVLNELSAEQNTEIDHFAAEESARVEQIDVKNKKLKVKDREHSLRDVQEAIRAFEWPDANIAKDWLTKADPTRRLGIHAGMPFSTRLALHVAVIWIDLSSGT